MTKKAIALMFEKHKNQVDKSGMPYVFHPFHVAEQMTDENTTIVALLHDIIEDTDVTFEDLRKNGFSDEVIEALTFLTHDPNINYYDYVERVGENDIARAVKIKDLEHNMDLSRIDNPTEKEYNRLEKYKKCHEYLVKLDYIKKHETNENIHLER